MGTGGWRSSPPMRPWRERRGRCWRRFFTGSRPIRCWTCWTRRGSSPGGDGVGAGTGGISSEARLGPSVKTAAVTFRGEGRFLGQSAGAAQLLMEMEEEEKKRLRHDLVDFTLQLHLNKVLPLDYNPKNIFYRKTNGKYHFALIDINRLKLGKVPGIRMSMNAFSQLGIPPMTS